ncbi:MAG TPA: carbamoyl phosphate synthase small subunit, partial [Burkholderiales bacterium]|nr:carbamoyl phosphate synthase small subunit [Burkholderiales bacterium]
MPVAPPALLVLADGTVFRGASVGAAGLAAGEVVFNTAITGYQEILTDPSYCRQIVTLTHPHVGNTGANGEDMESPKVFAAGLVVRDVPAKMSSWRAERSLADFLVASGVPAISGLDTRRLTRILREKGAQNGALLAGSDDAKAALEAARAFPGLAGMDLAKAVTTPEPYEWSEGKWRTGGGFAKAAQPRFHVAAYDYGVKRNILRMLVERGCRVTVLPAQTSAAEALALEPDGVFLSNGPGDPAAVEYAISAIRDLADGSLPI